MCDDKILSDGDGSMRIGKNELEILEYLGKDYGRFDGSKYSEIRRATSLRDDFTPKELQGKVRLRVIKAAREGRKISYTGTLRNYRIFYLGKNRVKFSQATNRLIKKGLIKIDWICNVYGTSARYYGDDSHTEERPDIYLKKNYMITDNGWLELNKRRRRLEKEK